VKLREVAMVAGKELRETLRDRRTVAVMVLFPLVVYPMVSLVTMQVMAVRATRVEASAGRVGVTGPPDVAAVVRKQLTERGRDLTVSAPSGDATADVVAGRLDAAAVVARGASGGSPSVRILFDETRAASRQAQERIAAALAGADCAPRFAVSAQGIAPQTSVGGYVLSKVLPLIVVVMVMLGAFHPAIDITAGERERGTLETTLSAPIDRFSLMTGKVLAVATLAAISGFLNLASMSLTVLEGARMVAEGAALALPWGRTLAVLAVVPPAAFLFAAVMVAVGAVARSFKEAQTLLTPIYFLCMAPSLTAALGDFELAGVAAVIPGVNVTLLARDLVVGHATLGITLIVFVTTLAYGAGALALAARLYDSERLLAADEPGLTLTAWLRRLFGRTPAPASTPGGAPTPATGPTTTPGQALALYGFAWVLLVALAPLQMWSVPVGLVALEWGGLLGLTLMHARGNGRRWSDVLHIGRPNARALAGAVLVGLSAWVVVGLLADWLFPAPKHVLESLRKIIAPPGGERGVVLTLFLTAVSPAVCEEALFRGPILRGLRARFSGVGAAVLCGLLFGLYHADPWRLLPTGALGVALATLALATGSIIPAMVAHLVNNTCLVLLARASVDDAGTLALGTRLALIGAGAVVLAAGFWLAATSRRTQRVM
jgi:sodium transport system permease protein